MFKIAKKRLKDQKGFTLIELLAVIVILGIIAAIAIPSVLNIIDNSKKGAHVANAQQMINSAKTAASDNNLAPTSGPVYLLLDYLQQKGYIENFNDPDGGSYNAGKYIATTTTGTNPTTATDFTAQPTGNVSYVEISIDSQTNQLVYSVQLYGSKRHIPLTPSSSLDKTSVVNN